MPIPRIWLAHSYNEIHPGVQLVFAPDGSKLFVKRGMAWRGLDYKTIQDRTIWSDCIDLTTSPIRSCGGVGTCCMSGEYEDKDIKEDSKKVEAIARAAGITD